MEDRCDQETSHAVVKWSAAAAAVVVSPVRRSRAPPAPQAPRRAPEPAARMQYKRNVGLEVDAMRREHPEDGTITVFSFAELGFQEFETTKYLDRHPRAERLHDRSAASPAFRRRGPRRWGSGKPVIALGSDIDDIPQASQKPGVAYHDPIIEGAPGHGEGPQLRHAAADRRGARGEEDHGAAAPARAR